MTGEKYWATDPEAGYELTTSPVSTVETTYDPAGNRLTQTGSVSGSYTANDINQYTAAVGGATPGNNSCGDLTDFNTQISSDWTFSYDAEGNLVTAAHPQADTITYHYDGFNERVGRTQDAETEWHLNVGSEMLEAYGVTTGESTSYVYASGIDRPVAQIDELGNVQFLYQDYLGERCFADGRCGRRSRTLSLQRLGFRRHHGRLGTTGEHSPEKPIPFHWPRGRIPNWHLPLPNPRLLATDWKGGILSVAGLARKTSIVKM